MVDGTQAAGFGMFMPLLPQDWSEVTYGTPMQTRPDASGLSVR